MVLEPHSTFGFSLLLSGSDCPLCSVLFLVDSLTSLSCIYAAFCSGGRRHLLAPPGKDEKNFMYQKTMIVITIAFVSCLVWVCLRLPDANAPLLWLRSGMERYADRKLSLCCQFFVSGFVGLLTDLSMRRGFSPLHKRIASAFSRSHDSPSNDRFSPRARFTLHGKQYFRNTATFGILPSPLHSMIHRLQTEKRDSFRVRDSHPIPLFSEQECVSERFSAA